MIISVLNDILYKSSLNIPINYENYTYTACYPSFTSTPSPYFYRYHKGDRYEDGHGIYERIGDTLDVHIYDPAKSDTYKLNDVLFDNRAGKKCISYVSGFDGEYVPKQPEAYANVPTTMAFGSWNHRYAKIGTLVNNEWTRTTNGVVHKIRYDGQYWTYTLDKGFPFIINMLYSSSDTNTEMTAICVNSSNCTNEWVPRTVINRGGDLYIRTDDSTKVAENVHVAGVNLTPLINIADTSWGWTFVAPLNKYALIDKKKYTYIEGKSPIEYEVDVIGSFDSIAVNGLIADKITVKFKPDDGSAAIPDIVIIPKNNRDKAGRLSKYISTVIAYAPRDITGSVKIICESTNTVRIGGITVGLSVNAGFTNLSFTNKFIDRSPYERDQWGDVLYVPGLKQNVYKGTVDILITDYDMTNRLMTSIGGETVIINGSDSKKNQQTDDKDFFSSTMLVGRMKGFELRTKLENKDMAQMATYSLTVEEDV